MSRKLYIEEYSVILNKTAEHFYKYLNFLLIQKYLNVMSGDQLQIKNVFPKVIAFP